MKQQCIQAVAQALGKSNLNQQEIQNIEQRVIEAKKNIARKDRQRWHNLSDIEKLKEAAEQVALDIQSQLQRKKQIAVNDAITQSKNIAALDHPTLPASEVIDRMVAAHGDMSGVQSIDSKARAIASIYRGELVDFYTSIKGGLGVFTDQNLVKNIIQERFGQSSGDALAKRISDKMGDVFENMRDRFNRNGGDIGKLDDWGMPQTHDSEKLAVAGKEQWMDDAIQNIDHGKYVHEDGSLYSMDELKELLSYAFDSIVSNGANKTQIGKANFQGSSKVTSKHSESRVLHFKDADAWMEYQSKYGGMQFVDLIEAHVSSMSKDIALVESLGSNPKMAMKVLMDAAQNKDFTSGIASKESDAILKRAQVMFDEMTGANSPQSQVLANLGLAYRSVNVASMLGGTTLSSITDQAMIAKTASVHNIAYRKTFGELITQLNPKNVEDRELAHSLGLATEEMLGTINRWADDGLTSVYGKSEKLAKISNGVASQVMRVSLLNALTAASKVGFSKMLMAKYGDMTRSKAWGDLTDIDKELLTKTGLSERAWEVMRLAEPVVDRKGNKLMSARSIYEIPDDKLLAAMDGDFKNLIDDINSQIKLLNDANDVDAKRIENRAQRNEDIKRQLSDRLQKYANSKDAKALSEKQALQDRIDLIDAQKEAASVQADINTFLQAEKQANRIQDFLRQVEEGRHSDKAAQDTRRNVERNARQFGNNAESLGYRLGNAERRIVELRAKTRKADSDANKAVKSKFNELDKKVAQLDEEFSQYQANLNERQKKRQFVIDRINSGIDGEKSTLAKKIRDEVATQLQTHLLDEQGMAVIEGGLRERTWMAGGLKRGTAMGEILRCTLQFKTFPSAFLMRQGSRTLAQKGLKGKAEYCMSLFLMTTLLGALTVQLKELVNGNDPQTMWDSDDPQKTAQFFGRSVVQGGGLSVLGDIVAAGTDPSGRGITDFMAGPFGSDVKAVAGITLGNTMQWYEGKDTNAANEAFKLVKGKIPAQNLWYTKAAVNRMFFDEIQDSIAPGYREKLLRKAQREQGRSQWWGDDIDDIQAPDFERVIQ